LPQAKAMIVFSTENVGKHYFPSHTFTPIAKHIVIAFFGDHYKQFCDHMINCTLQTFFTVYKYCQLLRAITDFIYSCLQEVAVNKTLFQDHT